MPNKRLLAAVIGLCAFSCAYAADNTMTQPANNADATNAIAFAIQAGQIAGTAQACGINIATFTVRVNEAINKLALNPTDSTAAISSYQQTLQRAQMLQTRSHAFACSQVTQDFNNLPLLRPDYEQTVIAQLNPGMTNNNQTTSATASGANINNANAAANNMPAQQNLVNQPMPNNTAPNPGNPGAGNANNAGINNPAYPQQNYGPMKSFSTNYSGAIKPYGMANTPPPAQQQQQQTTSSGYTAAPPPSFTNPNNNPGVYNNQPNQ